MFPLPFCCCQGGWEDDETVAEAACREALEEAGVRGILRVGSVNLSQQLPFLTIAVSYISTC